MEKENAFIDGAISVKAVIENESRPVFGLYISEKKLDDRNIRYIISQAKKKGINPEIVSADFFENDIFGKRTEGSRRRSERENSRTPKIFFRAEVRSSLLSKGLKTLTISGRRCVPLRRRVRPG